IRHTRSSRGCSTRTRSRSPASSTRPTRPQSSSADRASEQRHLARARRRTTERRRDLALVLLVVARVEAEPFDRRVEHHRERVRIRTLAAPARVEPRVVELLATARAPDPVSYTHLT